MKFSVDGWDPAYGPAFDVEELAESTAAVDPAIEVPTAGWAPMPVSRPLRLPNSVLFVDGVRRTDARIWIDDADAASGGERAVAGLCASYAAGVVRTSGCTAEVVVAEVRRRLITEARTATNISTDTGDYPVHHVTAKTNQPAALTLSNALQESLLQLELVVAASARAASPPDDHDLLIVDGPMRGKVDLPRTLGHIKTHSAQYLPTKLNAIVAELGTGERTPVFSVATGWQRYSWYLRLPCSPAGPWTGIVRLEASPNLDLSEVTELANVSQTLLKRFASVEYKDSRAPQNLVPIAGLEKQLRHRLGAAPLLYRSLRVAAGR
ncbi:hypothetical protein ACTXG7_24710 [Mycolicibacterium sp. Dal123E01]|uniref:hypothetical protein n=1 Tax=Mycolicibacterium sp. Dal123E01 TaxID=3457578 RepID=UPI00403E713F